MRITIGEAVERVAERTVSNTRDINRDNRQRRNKVVDLYGIEYTRQGDNGSPATFYISISPDMVYLERFQFKLIVQPFASTNGSGTDNAVVTVNDTSLATNGTSITPNPHTHSTQPHTHNLISGIALTHTDASDFRISINGVDVTAYLMAQHGWINGEGVYPSLDINENYDILEVASDLVAAGRKSDADKLVCAGYKPVVISSSKPFQITLVNYLKYSHLNR